MKVVEILDNRVHREYPEFGSASEAYSVHTHELTFVDAPNWVMSGFGFDPSKKGDERFIRPELSEGWIWDEDGNPRHIVRQREDERTNLHAATTNDTMQALRKLRQGDQTIDWQAWLDALDAYNVAIEETQNQEGYPQKVVYPEYPTKPAGTS